MKHLSVYIVAILVLMGATSAWPQSATGDTPEQTSAPDMRSITGRVVESTGTYLTIRTASGEQIAFAVDGQSKLPVSLPPNRMVTVEYQVLSNGTSRTVIVTPAADPQAGLAPASTPSARGATPAANSDESAMREDSSLPRTASVVPIIGLAGLFFLALGLAVSSRRRRRASV